MPAHNVPRSADMILAEGVLTADEYCYLYASTTMWLATFLRAARIFENHPAVVQSDRLIRTLGRMELTISCLQIAMVRYWRAAEGGEYLLKLGGWETLQDTWTADYFRAAHQRPPTANAPLEVLATDQQLYHLLAIADNMEMARLNSQWTPLEEDLNMAEVTADWDASDALVRVEYVMSTLDGVGNLYN